MSEATRKLSLGWLRDYPEFRDYTPEHDEVRPMLEMVGLRGSGSRGARRSLPAKVDLREWCPPVEDQGQLGSCTAHAGVGMVEYFERRAFGRHIDASRLFLYKATRNLMHATGDTGAFLRTTMGALVLFGVPPEEYWPYNVADFDKEPPAFCYAFAQNYQAVKYFRLDPPNTPTDALLGRIKSHLAAGLPVMFGFTVFTSIHQASATGRIPFPQRGERIEGGHAVMAVGYDDSLKIGAAGSGAETTGAILIRNSWGKGWGEEGYGWLPYKFVEAGLAVDWWSLIRLEWIDTRKFAV